MDNVFEQHPKLDAYFKASDGEAFYNENDAKNYAKKLKDKKVQRVARGSVSKSTPPPETKLDYREAIKAIQSAENLEALEVFKEYTQKSVIEALEKKTQEIASSINVDAEDVSNEKE